jgi:hypothetical protein
MREMGMVQEQTILLYKFKVRLSFRTHVRNPSTIINAQVIRFLVALGMTECVDFVKQKTWI